MTSMPRPGRLSTASTAVVPQSAVNDERATRLSRSIDMQRLEAVSFVETIRQDGLDLESHDAKNRQQKRGRRDPVHVVVADDRYSSRRVASPPRCARQLLRPLQVGRWKQVLRARGFKKVSADARSATPRRAKQHREPGWESGGLRELPADSGIGSRCPASDWLGGKWHRGRDRFAACCSAPSPTVPRTHPGLGTDRTSAARADPV